MKILHVIAQKPHSTGSGVYLSGMVSGFASMGCRQAVIAGLNTGEILSEKESAAAEGVSFYPLFYRSEQLDFPVLGMSDVMPYESTRYRDLDPRRLENFKKAFRERVRQVLGEFSPDLVLSHHLYLSTALLRELVPEEIPLAGICHETCLRQLQSNPLEREWIKGRIAELDLILALHDDQKKRIEEIFGVDPGRVCVAGSGYDSRIFYDRGEKKSAERVEIVYTGKMSRAKGVFSLLSALEKLSSSPERFGLAQSPPLHLSLIGGGNNQECLEIEKSAEKVSFPADCVGRLETQEEIADIYARSHIFVLPSFFEGLPLVSTEAMACGLEVVMSGIPGVQHWIESVIGSGHRIDFVELPEMETIDTPREEALDDFENRLALAIAGKIRRISQEGPSPCPEVTKLSWRGLCERIFEICGTLFERLRI